MSAAQRARDAASRFTRAIYALRAEHAEAKFEVQRTVIGWDAEALLEKVIGEAEMLVPLLNQDQEFPYGLESLERHVKDLGSALRKARLAAKLSAVEGRTPEEAEAFRAKAAALGGADA